DTVCSSRPDIVYCSITGEGTTPDGRGRPGFDTTAQARSGVLSMLTRNFDQPMTIKALIADLVTGYSAAYGVLGALMRRVRTGRGELIETSLLQSAVAFNDVAFFNYFHSLSGTSARPDMRTSGFLFLAGDEKPFAVHLPPSPETLWRRFVAVLDAEWL